MKVQTYQLLRAVVLTLALAILFAPSALADRPAGLDPWGYDALHQSHAGNPAPLGENATGQRIHPSPPTAFGAPDPWAYNLVGWNDTSAAPTGEHAAGQGAAPAAPAAPIGEHGTGQNSQIGESQPASLTIGSPARTVGGFQWGDAAIGAGLATALSLLIAGAAIALRRRAALAH